MAYDAIIVGSGAGGGTAARALAEKGRKVLLIERGGWVPQEPANASAREVFLHGRYTADETWLDARSRPFRPQAHYNVGGATRHYGAALFRLQDQDLERWPLGMADLAPFYRQAEDWYHVHALPHAPVIQRISDVFLARGLHPFHAPVGVIEGTCVKCDACDGFPCPVLAKADAQTCGVQPALDTGNVTLMTDAKVEELENGSHGIAALLVRTRDGLTRYYTNGAPVILAAGAVNSAALWLRSGLPDVSGQAGRNYMCHYSQAVLAIGRERLPREFHKTLAVLDWYDGLGSVQMAGQPHAAMLRGESRLAKLAPELTLREIAERSAVFWLMTEDTASLHNQVTVDDRGTVTLNYKAPEQTMIRGEQLYRNLRRLLPSMGFHAHLRKIMPLEAVAHQCGTLRLGMDRGNSAVDPEGRAWDIGNLYVADASVFPSSGAVNPALTVMAHALRVASRL